MAKLNKGVYPFIIGISGGTAAGKSTLSQKIYETLFKTGEHKIVIISIDSFYKSLSDEDKKLAIAGNYNFDHPDAFDFEELHSTLLEIQGLKSVTIFNYDHKTFSRSTTEFKEVTSDTRVIIIEGLLAFYYPIIRNIMHLKVFVDCDSDTRLSRRVMRDTIEKDRDLKQIITNYFEFVKPAFEEFCLPTKTYADIILPRGPDNLVGIDLIIQHIEDVLNQFKDNKEGDGNCGETKIGSLSINAFDESDWSKCTLSASLLLSPSNASSATGDISCKTGLTTNRIRQISESNLSSNKMSPSRPH